MQLQPQQRFFKTSNSFGTQAHNFCKVIPWSIGHHDESIYKYDTSLKDSAGKLAEIVAQCPKRKINLMRILSTWTDSTGFCVNPEPFHKITELALFKICCTIFEVFSFCQSTFLRPKIRTRLYEIHFYDMKCLNLKFVQNQPKSNVSDV